MLGSTTAAGSHDEAMDRMYRFTRHVYDVTRKPYLLGRDRMLAGLDIRPGDTVLEIGCGTGRNLVAAASRAPEARFVGLDISREMLRTAAKSVEKAGLSDRIRLVRGDATAIDADAVGSDAFDRVFFSYSLSMVPDWTDALCEGARLTAPGGRLGVVDFGDARGLGLARLPLWRWLALFHVNPRVDLEAALQILSAGRARMQFDQVYRGYAQVGFLDRPTA